MKRKRKVTRRTKKSTRAIHSSKKALKESYKSASYFMKYTLDQPTRKKLVLIKKQFKTGKDSKWFYSSRGKNAGYKPSRKVIHKRIINSILRQDKKTKKADVYALGGIGGSGKSSTLKKFIKEKALTINNDKIKALLTKYSPSPVKRYPLLHAAFLHRESKDIEQAALKAAINKHTDIILDRTLGNYKKNRALLLAMKKKGYKVHVLGTNLKPHIALIRTAARFIKAGRYVPLKIILQKGNKTNSSVLKMAKQKFVSRSRVYSTAKRKPRLIYKKG